MADIQLSRIVNSYYTSNTFVLSSAGCDFVWLVDCGDYWRVKDLLQGKEIKGVLLTHTHSDHIYGINELIADFPNVVIYTNEFGKRALSDAKLNISKYHSEIADFLINPNAVITILNTESDIELFPDLTGKVLFTPGHDKSSLSFIVGDYLFSGDSYIPTSKLVASFPNSNKSQAKESYDRLKAMSKSYVVCPGHGPIERQ